MLGVIGAGDLFPHSALGKIASKYLTVERVEAQKDIRSHVFIVWTKNESQEIRPDRLPVGSVVLNAYPLSVRKSHVQKCFARIFGREISVDPATHHGPCVEKSEGNAAHDGRVIECPVPPEQISSTKVYQRLVQNIAGEHEGTSLVCDFRLPVIGNTVPFAYVKFRPQESRFSNSNTFCRLVAVSDVISSDEKHGVLSLAREMRLDYGEIDILRDFRTGLIYVVDVNNRPFGPPNGLSSPEVDTAIRLMGSAFLDQFFVGM